MADVAGLVSALLKMALVFGLFFGLPIWAIVDASRRRPEVWSAAGHKRTLWLVVQFFAWIIGSAIYLFAIGPELKRAATAALLTPGERRIGAGGPIAP